MFSKLLVLTSYLVIANAGTLSAPALHAPAPAVAYGVNTGHSSVSRSQDAHGNYAFGYDVTGHLGDQKSRQEQGDGYGNVRGSYSIADIDGRQRIVDYVADVHGFRANVATNEPGTLPSGTGAAIFNGGAASIAAPLIAGGPAINAFAAGHGYTASHGYAAAAAHSVAPVHEYASGPAINTFAAHHGAVSNGYASAHNFAPVHGYGQALHAAPHGLLGMSYNYGISHTSPYAATGLAAPYASAPIAAPVAPISSYGAAAGAY